MQFKMTDSDSRVNGAWSSEIRISAAWRAKVRVMNRDEPVSDYVRKLIHEWEAKGKLLKDLAHIARTAPSMPSQVKKGTGVGSRSRAGFARAFEMTEDQLIERAFEWWKKEGRKVSVLAAPVVSEHPGRAEAIEVVKDLARVTDAQIRPIIEAYGADMFASRDKEWWVRTLLTELEDQRRRGVMPALVEKENDAKRAKVRAWKREGFRTKEAAAAAKRTPSTPPHRAKRSG